MKTGCKDAIEYQGLSGRKVISQFNRGQITTDAGGLLLRGLEQARGFMKEFSKCFTNYRDQDAIEHTVEELLSQRIYGIALGYEDLNDHDQLRIDPLLAVLCKKKDPTGQDRRSKSVLDLDATDDPIHGSQEGRFFHEWPEVKIVVRGDSGSAREEIMSWCEANHVDYLFGLARNSRLQEEIQGEMEEARKQYEQTGRASRVYKDFFYKTVKSWSKGRRVVGKVEYLEKGPNPRFVVTSLKSEEKDARSLYEQEYCARGEMENRIKEQQLHLFADRTSTETMRANQLRLWFSSVAYVLLNELRRIGLCSTEFSQAQCSTIRTKLLKIGAQVKVSVRRIAVCLSSAYPYKEVFQRAFQNIRKAYPMLC
ncbi:IS1380 family transposase [Candidatus Brocadia sinica]|uniref:Transposase DDE domain-containing protein n=1 Tax=Candidatus Brocadia sinica JPN1 TaxID=1197129 RepID=A0ABQ0K2K8_9BACT|nr:IS1380 family transposase [Candidatus Brocadia sinica]NOG42773.1 IS1380 family transposase [Planctomycetota bacterium]GAN34992.1 hypothetical protein BROSI_A3537 [Candidatus Brocadia sinica JPN1]GIK12006.1 MAG: IS1380 family transposase [Candidatus Brocadia sinica]